MSSLPQRPAICVLLALAACSSSGGSHRRTEPVQPAPPPPQQPSPAPEQSEPLAESEEPQPTGDVMGKDSDWGTAGLGGRGGMRGRTAAVPRLSLGLPAVQGDLDKAIVRRYFKRNQQKLQYCYEKELLVKPSLEGTVNVELTIESNGNTSGAKASGVDPAVASCVRDVVSGIVFPKPKSGVVKVSYALIFRLSDMDGGPAAP